MRSIQTELLQAEQSKQDLLKQRDEIVYADSEDVAVASVQADIDVLDTRIEQLTGALRVKTREDEKARKEVIRQDVAACRKRVEARCRAASAMGPGVLKRSEALRQSLSDFREAASGAHMDAIRTMQRHAGPGARTTVGNMALGLAARSLVEDVIRNLMSTLGIVELRHDGRVPGLSETVDQQAAKLLAVFDSDAASLPALREREPEVSGQLPGQGPRRRKSSALTDDPRI